MFDFRTAQAAPPDGLTIVHGIGRHSVTPFAPPIRVRILQFLTTHPVKPDSADSIAEGEEALYAIHLGCFRLFIAPRALVRAAVGRESVRSTRSRGPVVNFRQTGARKPHTHPQL